MPMVPVGVGSNPVGVDAEDHLGFMPSDFANDLAAIGVGVLQFAVAIPEEHDLRDPEHVGGVLLFDLTRRSQRFGCERAVAVPLLPLVHIRITTLVPDSAIHLAMVAPHPPSASSGCGVTTSALRGASVITRGQVRIPGSGIPSHRCHAVCSSYRHSVFLEWVGANDHSPCKGLAWVSRRGRAS